MVKVAMPAKIAVATCLYAAVASAESVNFINKCTHPIELYHSQKGSAAAKVTDIAIGGTYTATVTGPAHMYRHTADTSATLLELACDGTIWVDISIIPPLPGWCSSYEDCKAGGTKSGFNVPMSVVPKTNVGVGTCSPLFCAADNKDTCADAYLFPMDNTKTHSCPTGTVLDVTFCYANGDNTGTTQQDPTQQDPTQDTTQQDSTQQDPTQQDPTQDTTQQEADPTTVIPPIVNNTLTTTTDAIQEEPGSVQDGSQSIQETSPNQGTVEGFSDLGNVKSKYSYCGKNAGNVAGSYDAVTDLGQCTKEKVSVQSPVGPMSEAVSLIFRGPMEIDNIAVFSAEGGNGSWKRVSSYSRQEGMTDNLVFMNNKNVDYSGQDKHGPQGYASADGNTKADEPTVFAGVLGEASDPSKIGGGPGISTGSEINIMTAQKCNGQCLGYSGDNDYQGWAGGKKAFVTKVKMPKGSTPDQPAIWMLNAQVMHSNQYSCNCRGMGAVGGCGELDIAEVIETNPSRDKVTTHYYFFDGDILSPGGDNFAPRPYDEATVYVTLIDDSNDGLIKIVELSSFDFTLTDLGSLYQQLVDC